MFLCDAADALSTDGRQVCNHTRYNPGKLSVLVSVIASRLEYWWLAISEQRTRSLSLDTADDVTWVYYWDHCCHFAAAAGIGAETKGGNSHSQDAPKYILDPETGPQALPTLFLLLLSDFPFPKALSFLNRM